MANEFEIIQQCFQPLSSGLSKADIGIGDDGAVISVPDNHQIVVVTDTLVSGVHFPENSSAYDIGWKALAVNLSDLAAMGAKPGVFSLALTLPNNDPEWLKQFSEGLADLSQQFQIPLIGGDTTKGPLTVTVTAQGWVEQGKAVLRSGAKAGDLVCVTNSIGDGALGLKLALNTLEQNEAGVWQQHDRKFLLEALNRPLPQLNTVELLNKFANSAIDISDGLLADLQHILEMSSAQVSEQLGVELNLNDIPLSVAADKYIQQTDDWGAILAGGDDYQLCFTVDSEKQMDLIAVADRDNIKVSVIGRVNESGKIRLLKDGESYSVDNLKGYLHF